MGWESEYLVFQPGNIHMFSNMIASIKANSCITRNFTSSDWGNAAPSSLTDVNVPTTTENSIYHEDKSNSDTQSFIFQPMSIKEEILDETESIQSVVQKSLR